MKRPYAIITARGGSKRIPKKNIRSFCGKPIISYSIEAALESRLFEEVIISTDSEEIAEIGKKYGACIPFMRSRETSGDFAGTADVLHEVIEMYQEQGTAFEEFCCIYPTAPFITPEKLKESYELLHGLDVCSVVSMTAFSFPPQRGMKITGNGFLVPADAGSINMRSQDLPVIYHDCGQFYWLKTAEFLINDNILENHAKPYFIPQTEAQDIDNESDWRLAEIKYKFMKGNRQDSWHSE